MRTTELTLIIVVLALAATITHAATFQVKQDGTGDFTTIQEAIDAASGGDEIVVHPGTYYENIHFDGKKITLRSLDPEQEEIVASTIIDGQQKGSVVTFAGTEDETCLLCGFTIKNGTSTLGGGGINGAGAHAGISNCTISGNSATGDYAYGGGLAGCNGTISKCTVRGNSATGQFPSGGGLSYCDGTINNCTISGNSATGDYAFGGGLDCCGGPISNCTITGNSAYGIGGGLSGCNGPISNCMISANTAREGGGALFGRGGTVGNCTISDNWATGDYSHGGGLYYYYGTITNCIVWGNYASSDPDLWNCNYTGITYSCIRRWTGGGGNISNDPLFVKGPLGDYYLSCGAAGQAAGSPCIDAGKGTAESLGLNKLTTRTDEVPDAGVVDMGYHYPLGLGQNPQIECSLNASEFRPGDLLVGFMEAHNPGPDIEVDAYIEFVLPDGAVISLTTAGFGTGMHPWVSDVVLLSGSDFGPSEVLRISVPQGPGIYLFAAALTEPGQFDFIGEPSLFAFRITENGRGKRLSLSGPPD